MDRLKADLKALEQLLIRSWAKGGTTADAKGNVVSVLHESAIQFDLIGAAARIANDDIARRDALFTALAQAAAPEGIAMWDRQPGRTLKDVTGLIQKAIKANG